MKMAKYILGALAATLLSLALPLALSPQSPAGLKCFYDDVGQLTTVVYPSGDVVRYTYDSVGNILSISKTTLSSPGALAIFNVTPAQGDPGTTVTIQGQGFSATPANDALQFNGTAATVTSATATTLVASVPNAATTGPLSVTVGGVTAQGPVFTVLPHLAIAPTNPSIPLGTTKQFTATNILSDGTTQDVTTSVTWSSSNGAAASISNTPGTNGLATSLATGTSTITATSGVRTASTTLTLTPAVPVSVGVTPANFSVFSGLTVQYTAIVTFTDGSTQDVTTSATWSSSNPAVATISNTAGSRGLATAIATGTTTIMAAHGPSGLSGSTSLTVSAASQAVPRFAYVLQVDGTVSIYAVNLSTGDLRPIGIVVNPRANFFTTTLPYSLGIDPANRFLYVGNTGFAQIYASTLNQANGGLTLVLGSPFQGTNVAGAGISIDAAGRFLYDAWGGGPETWSIDQGTGALTFQGRLNVPGTAAFTTTLHPSGRFLYIPVLNPNNSIAEFTVDPISGLLTAVPGTFPAGLNPEYLAVDPAGKFAYAANLGSNNVSAYTIDGVTGVLTQVAGLPVAAGSNPSSAVVHPSSKFLYVGNSAQFSGSASVSAYTIDSATGGLTPIAGSPFSTGVSGGQLNQLSLDPTGQFLYEVRSNGLIFAWNIDPTSGVLTLLKPVEAQATLNPISMAISKGTAPVTFTPKFAYAANSGSNNISAFTVDPASGALAQVSGSPFAAGMQPNSLAVHPAGKFAYAVNTVDKTISVYGVDSTTGALTPIGSPIAEGQVGAGAAIIDPSGQYLYVVNTNAPGSQGTVSAYQINSTTGALTPITGSPFAAQPGAGINSSSLTTDPQGRYLLVTNSGSNDLSVFSITSPAFANAGALRIVTNPPQTTGTKPVAVASGPVVKTAAGTIGPVAYVANSGSGDISTYVLAIGSGLPTRTVASTLVGPNPQSLVVDPTGKFLYVAGGNPGSAGFVAAFSIDSANGNPTAINGSPFTAGTGPVSVTVDISGQFVLVTNSGSNNVSVFKINPATGALTPVTGSPFPAGTAPKWVTTTGTIQ